MYINREQNCGTIFVSWWYFPCHLRPTEGEYTTKTIKLSNIDFWVFLIISQPSHVPIVDHTPFISASCKIIMSPAAIPVSLSLITLHAIISSDLVCVYPDFIICLPSAPHSPSPCNFYEYRIFIWLLLYPQLRIYLAHMCRKGFKVKRGSHS